MVNKYPNTDSSEAFELPPHQVLYEFGFIRLLSAVWAPADDSPIQIGPVVLDLGF
jgi:hypothetical protein